MWEDCGKEGKGRERGGFRLPASGMGGGMGMGAGRVMPG